MNKPYQGKLSKTKGGFSVKLTNKSPHPSKEVVHLTQSAAAKSMAKPPYLSMMEGTFLTIHGTTFLA